MFTIVACGKCGTEMVLVRVSSPDGGTTLVRHFVCPNCGMGFTERTPPRPVEQNRKGVSKCLNG